MMTNATPYPNADPAELAKFSALAHRWWDPGSEFRPLHEINPLRLAWIERVAGGLRDKAILDVGCGGGILAEASRRRARDRHRSVRESPGRRAVASARIRGQRRLPADRAEALRRETPARFDTVTCMEMLEHAGSGLHHQGLRGFGETRRHARLLDAQPQPEVVCVRDPRRRIPVAIAAARHARLDQVPAPVRARGLCAGAPVSISTR